MNNILIEYSDNYSKTSGGLWQYYRDQPNATLTNSSHSNLRQRQQEKSLLTVIQRILKCQDH